MSTYKEEIEDVEANAAEPDSAYIEAPTLEYENASTWAGDVVTVASPWMPA